MQVVKRAPTSQPSEYDLSGVKASPEEILEALGGVAGITIDDLEWRPTVAAPAFTGLIRDEDRCQVQIGAEWKRTVVDAWSLSDERRQPAAKTLRWL